MLVALAEGKNVAIRSGHGVGKTALLAWCVLWYLDTQVVNVRIPCGAPTENQLKDVLWPEISLWRERNDEFRRRVKWQASRVAITGSEETMFATWRPAGPDNKPENLAGFHADPVHGGGLLFVIDEASGIGDRNWAPVMGALSGEGAQVILAGNPTRSTGYFHNRFVEQPEGWHLATVSTADSPRGSGDYIESMKAEWGEDSDEFRIRVLGLPPRGHSEGYIPPYLVDKAMEPATHERLVPTGPLFLGVDVARFGSDKSAIAARRGPAVLEIESYRQLSTDRLTQKVLDTVEKLRVDPDERVMVLVDDGGVGGGVTDQLNVARRHGSIAGDFAVQGVTFGGKGDRWHGTNAGVWWHRMRRMMQENALALPQDEGLRHQLTDRMSSVNLTGKTVLETKDHLRDRGVGSPDKADAVALTVAQAGAGQAFIEAWTSLGSRDLARAEGIDVPPMGGPVRSPAVVKAIADRDRRRKLLALRKQAGTAACHHFWGPPVGDQRFCAKCGEPHGRSHAQAPDLSASPG